MRLLLISLLLIAQSATAREAMPTDPAPGHDASVVGSVQDQPSAAFTPIDVRAISSELNAKLELMASGQLEEEGGQPEVMVSAN